MILLALVLQLPAVSHAGDVLASMRQQLASEIKYDPPPASDPNGEANGLELVVLEPVVVQSGLADRVASALVQKREEELAEKFDLRNGGTLLKAKIGGHPVKLGLEYNGKPGVGGTPPPVFTLISVK